MAVASIDGALQRVRITVVTTSARPLGVSAEAADSAASGAAFTKERASRKVGPWLLAACWLLFGFFATEVNAQSITAQGVPDADLYLKEIGGNARILPSENPFGEYVNPQTGGLSFRQTDIDLPGIGPEIKIIRTFDVQSQPSTFWQHYGKFADWQLEIPRIMVVDDRNDNPNGTGGASGENVPNGNWDVVGSEPMARCSRFQVGGGVNTTLFFRGMQLEIPGAGRQEILVRSAENTIAPSMSLNGVALNFPLVTNQGWAISCLPDAVKNGKPGEAFLAVSPDGIKYWFDWMTFDYAGEWWPPPLRFPHVFPLPNKGLRRSFGKNSACMTQFFLLSPNERDRGHARHHSIAKVSGGCLRFDARLA